MHNYCFKKAKAILVYVCIASQVGPSHLKNIPCLDAAHISMSMLSNTLKGFKNVVRNIFFFKIKARRMTRGRHFTLVNEQSRTHSFTRKVARYCNKCRRECRNVSSVNMYKKMINTYIVSVSHVHSEYAKRFNIVSWQVDDGIIARGRYICFNIMTFTALLKCSKPR